MAVADPEGVALAAWVLVGAGAWTGAAAALLAFGTATYGGHLPGNLRVGVRDLLASRETLPPKGCVLCGIAVAVLVWQLTHVACRWATFTRGRRSHRVLLDVVGSPDETLGVVVLDDARPFAYHVPGWGDHRLVVTRGCLDRVSDLELGAVLAHERAHLRGRHQVVVQGFLAWQQTYPRLIAPRLAARAVQRARRLLPGRRLPLSPSPS